MFGSSFELSSLLDCSAAMRGLIRMRKAMGVVFYLLVFEEIGRGVVLARETWHMASNSSEPSMQSAMPSQMLSVVTQKCPSRHWKSQGLSSGRMLLSEHLVLPKVDLVTWRWPSPSSAVSVSRKVWQLWRCPIEVYSILWISEIFTRRG